MNEDAGDGVGVGLPVVGAMGCCLSGDGWAVAVEARARTRVERSMLVLRGRRDYRARREGRDIRER